MLKLGRVTKVKVLFLVLVYVFNFDLFEFSAAILEKGLLELIIENPGNTRGQEEAFGCWFADELYREFSSSATQAICQWILTPMLFQGRVGTHDCNPNRYL